MHPVLPSVHPIYTHIFFWHAGVVDPSGQTPIKSKGVDRGRFMCSRPSYFSFTWGRTLSAKISSRLASILPAQDGRTRRNLAPACCSSMCRLGIRKEGSPLSQWVVAKMFRSFLLHPAGFSLTILPFSYFWQNLRRIYYGYIRGKICQGI